MEINLIPTIKKEREKKERSQSWQVTWDDEGETGFVGMEEMAGPIMRIGDVVLCRQQTKNNNLKGARRFV